MSSGVAQWWECIDSDRKLPGEECTESNRFECRALKEGAANDLVLSKSQTFIARWKKYPRKPAARRSDCIGKLACLLQTGRGAAFKLVLLGEFDRPAIKPH
jgi:hypothetical protein